MIQSMTGFASGAGQIAGWDWRAELRAVNGKGRELRLRLPEVAQGAEAALRRRLVRDIQRGNVTCNLHVTPPAGQAEMLPDPARLEAALRALAQVEAAAARQGRALAPSSAVDILSLRGLGEAATPEAPEDLEDQLLAALEPVIATFLDARRREGEALRDVLEDHLRQIEGLVTEAEAAAEARRPRQREALQAAIARLTEGEAAIDEARVHQELALLAVKSDVTEEIDRLRTHVAEARGLLAEGGAVGRRLDFLAQEFNREANTLCAKAQDKDLTRVGLALKAVIDQMREQVQNVE